MKLAENTPSQEKTQGKKYSSDQHEEKNHSNSFQKYENCNK